MTNSASSFAPRLYGARMHRTDVRRMGPLGLPPTVDTSFRTWVDTYILRPYLDSQPLWSFNVCSQRRDNFMCIKTAHIQDCIPS